MTATMSDTKPGLSFYNFDKIRSFNAKFNFVVGGRGLGKTFGGQVKAIKDGITKGDQFIYLRRYQKELQASKESFFAAIEAEGFFEEYDFRVDRHYAQFAPAHTRDDKKRPWKTIGYFMALSTAQSQKSVAFPLVKTILFDEFIIEKGMVHYLPNEVRSFLQFYSTVDRNKDKTRVYFFANAVAINNPYFIHYKIRRANNEEWVKLFKNATTGRFYVVCHFPDSEAYKAGVNATEWGQFINESDPEYASYATGNTFTDNNTNLLDGKPQDAKYQYTLETKEGVFSIWLDWSTYNYYIQEKLPKQQMHFTIVPEKMAEGKKLLFNNDKQIQMLRTAFKSERVKFDSAQSKYAFIEIFRK